MRIAIVSDVHGNRTAFAAVLADLKRVAPDRVLHGGDLADAGSSPDLIVDQIRDFGWPGVMGNTDEMLVRPEALVEFAAARPQAQALWSALADMAAATRAVLGADRLAWLRAMPTVHRYDSLAVVHASPGSCWIAPSREAADHELATVFGPLGGAIVAYGHLHHPFIRAIPGMTIVNCGSVGLPYDGDRRASYLLLDDGRPTIRRVDYDVNAEVKALSQAGLPHHAWVAATLVQGRAQPL